MNFVAAMLKAPLVETRKPREYMVSKTKKKLKASPGRYRLCLEGERRTLQEIADFMGITYSGAVSSVRRMVEREQVVCVRKAESIDGNGKRPALYTWNKEAT